MFSLILEFSIRFLSALQHAEQITDEASLFVNYRYNYVVDGVKTMHLLKEKGLREKKFDTKSVRNQRNDSSRDRLELFVFQDVDVAAIIQAALDVSFKKNTMHVARILFCLFPLL